MLTYLRNSRIVGLLGTFFLWGTISLYAQSPGSLKETAKAAKISTDLVAVAQSNKATIPITTGGVTKKDWTRVKNGMIAIEAAATTADGQQLLDELQALGLQQGIVYKHMVFGFLPVGQLNNLKNVASLRFAKPSYKPQTQTGLVTSEGDKAMRSDIARQTFKVTGAGIKVGVLSDSYNALGGAANGVASGDLPAGVQVLEDVLGDDAIDEGRAMAEIIHDVAPGAAIAFNTAWLGQAGFAKGIINLANAGCKVIVDDIGYIAEPFFQDGIVAQAVNEVVKNKGVTYFSAAGNSARSSYESAFSLSAKLPPNDPFSYPFDLGYLGSHNYGNNDIYQRITIPSGRSISFIYQWDDAFYSVNGGAGAKTDLDILVFYKGVFRPDLSSLEANVGNDPVELISAYNGSDEPVELDIVIAKWDGPDPNVVKWVNWGDDDITVEYDTKSATAFGHPNAEGAIAVGAARYSQTPAFSTSLSAPVIEYFSSAGGIPVLFNADGTPLASPVIRNKPEIVAPDGGKTTFFYGLPGQSTYRFYGTSAAAPHAAAVAALMMEKAGGTLSFQHIRSYLQQSAIDMDDPLTPGFDVGFDFRTGYGLIQADKALAFVQPLALVQPLFNCQTGQLTFQTTGGDGTPIQYMAIGITGWSFNAVQRVEPALFADPNTKTLTLMARQSGKLVTYTFNFRAYCQGSGANQPPALVNPIANQLAQQNAAFNFVVPANTFADPNGDLLTYTAIGLPAGLTFNATTQIISGTPTQSGNFPLGIVATDAGGLSAQAMFTLIVTPTGGVQPLALITPLYNCADGTITFRTTGGDGTPITYLAIGVQRASLTDPTGIVEPGLRVDPKPLVIYARQSGVTVSFTFNFAAFCAGARTAVVEPENGLQVRLMGNPTVQDQVLVEVQGAKNQSLQLRVSNSIGTTIDEQHVELAGETERRSMSIGRSAGLYLLQVSTATGTKTVKIIRQ